MADYTFLLQAIHILATGFATRQCKYKFLIYMLSLNYFTINLLNNR